MDPKKITYGLRDRMLEGGSWHLGLRAVREGFSGPPHVHRGFHEVMLCFDGEVSGRLRDESVRLGGGQGHFVGEKDLHHVRCQKGSWANLAFTPDWLAWADSALGTGDQLRSLPGRPVTTFRMNHDELAEIRKAARSLLHRKQGGGDNLDFRILLLRIMAHFTQRAQSADHRARPGQPGWLSNALERFEALPPEARTRDRLIQLTGRSEAHVCRSFQRYRQESLSSYLNRLRVREAARLLRETSRSVTEVGLACGFNSLNHFHAEFRNNYHATPLRYRKHYLASM